MLESTPRPERRNLERALSVSPAAPDKGEPTEATKVGIDWSAASRMAVVGIFIMLLCVFLDQARVLLLPIVSALIIGTMLSPIVTTASRYRIPSWLSALVVIGLVILFFYLAIVLIAGPVVEWINRAPEIGQRIRENLQVFDRPLAALRDLRSAIGGENALKVDTGGPNLVAPALAVVTPAVGELLLFFATLFFFLWGRTELRGYLVSFGQSRAARLRTLRILNDVEHDLTGYLSVVAVINLCVGAITATVLFLFGFPNPMVWGVLAFILNFIPYLGPLTMEAVLFAIGLITFSTIGQALLPPLFFLALTTLEGHVITPSIMGRRLTLNPMLVFLALAFWTWLWGPVGTFLATPLLSVGIIVLGHFYPKPKVALPG